MNRILDLQKIDSASEADKEQRSGISFLCSSLSVANCAKQEEESPVIPI